VLVHLEGVIPPQALKQLNECLARTEFEDGRLTASGDLARNVKNNLQVTTHTPGYPQAASLLRDALMKHPGFRQAALPARMAPPMFGRYVPGMSYGDHFDASILTFGEAKMRTDISMTVFLSAPDEYEGGELVVQTEYGEQRFKGQAGDAVLYGASFLHRVNEVTEGTRTVAVTWIQSMIRDAAKRLLIYDLGRAANSLMEEFPDRQDVVAIEQALGRLERMWSDV